MLTLLTNNEPLLYDDYYIKELASGLDELVFSMSIWDPLYTLVQEESQILEQHEDDAAIYLVKAIDAGKETATIKAQIDLDEWRASMTLEYTSGSNKVADIVSNVAPTGWSVVDNSGIAYRRTITLEGATPLDVLTACQNTFTDITFRFDNVSKTVTIVNMGSGQNVGAFVTRELNLTQSDYKGKSTGFATRLYAYGKDGLSFASINDGKAYVENHSYSDKVICAPIWIDERYTNAASLLQDAQAKIDQLAVPTRSFDCNVIDLAAIDPDKYSLLSFPLFAKVWLIDETRSSSRIEHKVAERWIYPNLPNKNKVILSTAPVKIQSQVTQVMSNLTNVNSPWNQQFAAALEGLTATILGANGGSVRLLDTNGDGEPDTLYIADNPDPTLATKVWRFNYEGWAASSNGYNGPFTMGATLNGGIVADFITAGTMSANRINGGILSLGGVDNGNGVIDIYDSAGSFLGKMSNVGLWFGDGSYSTYHIKDAFAVRKVLPNNAIAILANMFTNTSTPNDVGQINLSEVDANNNVTINVRIVGDGDVIAKRLFAGDDPSAFLSENTLAFRKKYNGTNVAIAQISRTTDSSTGDDIGSFHVYNVDSNGTQTDGVYAQGNGILSCKRLFVNGTEIIPT